MNLYDLNINDQWSVFLDRDGVINRRRVDDYVKSWDEFEFLPGAPEALKQLSHVFGTLIVVSNQQGIGKGVMKAETVDGIHRKMLEEVRAAGGTLHGIYYSPYLEGEGHPWRKPDTGMALQAQLDFPRIDFKKAVMVGDSQSDMIFGRRLGMMNVLIETVPGYTEMERALFDVVFPDLLSFSMEFK